MKRLNEVERKLAESAHRRIIRWSDAAVARSRYRGANPVLRRRYALAEAMLICAVAVNGVFALVDLFYSGYTLQGAVEGIAALVLCAVLVSLRRSGRIDRAMLMLSAIAGIAILVAVFFGRAHDSVLAWASLFPAVPGFLLGVRRGVYVAGVFYLILFSGLVLAIVTDGPQGFTWLSLVNAGGASLVAGFLVFFYEFSRSDTFRRLEEAANRDPLTGSLNRRGFQDRFDAELDRARRGGTPISLLIFDVDHFKHINDRYGHDAGDAAIRHLSDLLTAHTRCADLLGRLGGEEFALALPGAPLAQAQLVAEKLRRLVEATPMALPGGGRLGLTVSIGVAQISDEANQFRTLFSVADRRLYAAKKAGRNRVCVGDLVAVPEEVP